MVRWNVEFIDILANQEGLTGGVYDHTLVRMTTLLEEDCVLGGGNRRPVLPTYTNNNNNIRWFEIRFYPDPRTRVRTRFRRDDLYLYCYQVNDQRWLEFGNRGDPNLVDPNSDHLGFGSSYRQLRGAAGGMSLTLGREALINAVDLLATSARREDRAQGLLVIILMFSEAARFVPVRNYVQRVFYGGGSGGGAVPDWVTELIHRWGKLSGYILYYLAHPNEEWVPQTITIEAGGAGEHRGTIDVVARTIGQMLYYMGILQRNPEKIQPAPRN